MGGPVDTLFPELPRESEEGAAKLGTGILASQQIRLLRDKGTIRAKEKIDEDQIQPASLDLRLGQTAYRIRASFLPGPKRKVAEMIDEFSTHQIDLTNGAVLEKGFVYIVQLQEHVRLNKDFSATANPKSSIGRLDIFTRLITDNTTEFDRVRPSYMGPLYAEISPLAFSVVVRTGSRLSQLRFIRGKPIMPDTKTRGLLDHLRDPEPYRGGQSVTVDLEGSTSGGLIGFRARKHTPLIDVDKQDHYDADEFWEPIYSKRLNGIILDPDDFYILASREGFSVPADHAAEMVAYDTLVGEFRVHYAGFFDPGFGGGGGSPGNGTRAVLEVRSHEVPFMVEDGQIVGRLLYERLSAEPDKLYGPSIGSSYQHQGLTLGKQFKPYEG